MDVSEIARRLGKLGGSVKSKAKAKAARENGKLGGRPGRPKISSKRNHAIMDSRKPLKNRLSSTEFVWLRTALPAQN
jgi:hypothetical protein